MLTGGHVYTMTWSDPAIDGTPAADAPLTDGRYHPDAEALAVRDGVIVGVGSATDIAPLIGRETRVLDLGGATVLPGLVDSHTHVQGLGARLRRVDLRSVVTVQEVVERFRARYPSPEPGERIVGWGWDEGAWASHYPTHDAITAAFPGQPVVLQSLHSFAVWANRAALDQAGIGRDTPDPVGGEIRRDAAGLPSGILLNRATTLLDGDPAADDPATQERDIAAGLAEMRRSGYVTVHEAGLDRQALAAFARLAERGDLPVRVYAMLSARDEGLLREWIARGPQTTIDPWLQVRSVKAFWDGALGSRGARLLQDYTDQPGHRGVSGEGYGFDLDLVRDAIGAGFQVAIHAIGDAGNRETLDFLEGAIAEHPAARAGRHRVEHAQVVHQDDFAHFGKLGLWAPMQPPHLAEDKAWAEDRLGPERILGAYAWRTMRRTGAGLVFSSDLPGSDHDFFYGLHAAVTRRDAELQPPDGFYPQQAVTVDEAIRAYTVWAARVAFREASTGTLEPGRWADVTVIDIDPFEVAADDPGRLLDGKVRYTIVDGVVRAAHSDL